MSVPTCIVKNFKKSIGKVISVVLGKMETITILTCMTLVNNSSNSSNADWINVCVINHK